MKLFTISGATTLFCILAPVTAISDHKLPGLTLVPEQNGDFSFNCPNGQTYTKDYLSGVVQEAIQIIHNSPGINSFPTHFNAFLFNIRGQQWFYPLRGNDKPMEFSCFARSLALTNEYNLLAVYNLRDYVVFTTDYEIAGVIYYRTSDNGEEQCFPCQFA
ncbi:CSEP0344 putative effector protein [Blumeria hordei DH14]|uniref:CSEP0344 putative effector protein n=1 Tax=Blumeria graminis f. sp. hordei (strain DH14) TaxID=546991 RepID=N1JDX1_BLUG1|nr:CSEP0344 putative effector protein [Blumeria hordei DH14]